ncbi:DNA-directed RNA polymerase II 19 kDa polypeptide [Patellaria atrata CBS 101060]|uniref:DNA-directed RNA polymerase subunit n=1 Tax=Patellaria atrata CBS 101060 TaxID=1346257 RepID=A0A9P4VQG3_9PEZI|nr:DNA-directed RNA polymerase II 19 kDa polypeptide [Patellaria atrata CBS 101060]
MFFLHEMERTILIHPSFFGPRMRDYIDTQLLHDVEGKNAGSYFIICVMEGYHVSEGRVVPGSSHAEYTVHYRAVVWRPFKGEVVNGKLKQLDGIVTSVVETGFFVDVGPISAFVAKTMIPSDIKFDGNATPAQWTDNADQVIEKGTHIRLKVKGIRVELGSMFAIATIKEDYLGPLA